MNATAELAGPQGDLLGMLRLQGQGFPAGEQQGALLDLRIRLSSEENLERSLRQARASGWPAVVALGESRLFAALKRGGDAAPRPAPVVPNLQGLMREAVEYGLVGAGLRRAWRVGPLGLMGLGLRSVGRAPAILRRDFPTMLRSFVELELSEWSRLAPPVIFLQEQMTDLALAMDNPRMVTAFAEAVRQRTGAGIGFVTNNFAQLADALKHWGIEPKAIITPWDARGLRLRPDAAAWQEAARGLQGKIWAIRRDWLAEPAENERALMTEMGIAGVLREDLAVWNAFQEEANP